MSSRALLGGLVQTTDGSVGKLSSEVEVEWANTDDTNNVNGDESITDFAR
jgi:hypothetical protein